MAEIKPPPIERVIIEKNGKKKISWGFTDWIGLAIVILVLCFVGVVAVALVEGESPIAALSMIKDFVLGLVHGTTKSN